MRLIEWAVTSSILILMVALVRALLGKRMGAGARYALWGLVLLRLLIPVQLFSVPVPESVRDALEPPASQTAVPAPAYPPAEDGDPGTVVLTPATPAPGAGQEDMPPAIHDIPGAPVTPAAPAPRSFDWRGTLGWLWLGGAAAMGLALVICNARFAVDLRCRRRPIGADCGLPVYAVERLESPCLFGIVRPAVYVTSETAANPAMLRHVLAHETTHARHGDQVWSLLRCAALATHWWNPLVWLAAFLSRRDAELACDEGAIRLLGDGERKAYGWTLLTLITAQPSPASLMSAATTMSGGKKALWERVQRIAHAPKKAVWAAALAVVLAAAVTACAFSSAAAPQEEPGESPDPTVSASPEPTAPGNSAALAAYEDILNGRAGFLFGEETKTVTDVPAMFDIGDSSVRIQRYALADVDRDGEDEMMLCVCGAADDMEGYLVLNREAGQVYGYQLGFWGDIELRADGTYFSAYSSADFGAYRLDSQGGEVFVAARVPNYDLNNSEPAYVVEGETVDRETFEAAYQREKAKPEAPWYDFTQENIDAMLGSAVTAEPAATAQIDGRTVTLTMDYRGGNPDGEVGGAAFTLICDGNQARFTDDWVEETPITLAGADLDGDGADEVVLAYTTSHLTGGLIQSLRVFDGETLDERAAFTRDDLPGVIFEQVTLTGSGDSYLLTAPGVAEIIAKSEWDESYPAETDLMNTMAFGNYYEFTVSSGRLYCDLGIWQGQCGSVRVVLGLGNGGLACKSFWYVPAAADIGDLTALQTDLNRNGVPETLELVEIDGGKQLRVMENGCCVWSEDGFYAHGGWNTLFLCRFDGLDWLLRYNPYMSTGNADHSYTLFSFTDGDGAVTGKVLVKQIGGMRFDTNFGQSMHEPMDTEAVAGFLRELSPLLEDAQPLLNTNSELEDLHERTGRWLTYPWDQFSTGGFAYNRNKTLEDNLRAWEEAGEFPDRQSAIALAAYLDILNGRRAFVYSTDWGMDPMGVAGIHALFDPYDPSMRIREYALLDRDQDGVDEMVLYVCGASDDKGGCLVLDLADGVNVYGHKLDRREVGDAAWQEMPYSAPAGSGGLPFVGPFLFEFCSGAGGWSTDLTLNADGTFTGEYSDSDMGDSGPGYHGTEYVCTFHGRFGDIKQVSEHVWSLTLAELVLDTGHPIGEEWTEGGTRYISSAPYGLSAAGADAPPEPGAKFMLYTPGATQKETGADEEFYWWLHMGPRMDFRCWALHNLDTDYGFLAR